MKRIAIILVSIVAVFGVLLFWFVHSSKPPKEAELIQNFNAHRASFERLRDMLESDTHILRVADWGVETDKGMFKPPAGNFSIERYNQYLALLKESGGKGAGRADGTNANPTILLWGVGFGGDIAHIGISWMDEVPNRQVGSLDQYYRDHKAPVGSGWVCQHIDGNWYLWTDLWTQ